MLAPTSVPVSPTHRAKLHNSTQLHSDLNMSALHAETTRILIVSDSRGYGLEAKIKHGLITQGPEIPIHIDFMYKGGLTIEGIVRLLDQSLNPNSELYDYIYVFGGVNNLSVKHKSGKITAVYDDIGHFVENMYERLFTARNYLFKYSYRPVICQLVGLSFDKYNELEHDQIASQHVINQAVPLLNHAINSINTDVEAVSPWIGSTIHAIIHHKYTHKYMRLRDGLHPTEELVQIWTDCFVHAILKNYSWLD